MKTRWFLLAPLAIALLGQRAIAWEICEREVLITSFSVSSAAVCRGDGDSCPLVYVQALPSGSEDELQFYLSGPSLENARRVTELHQAAALGTPIVLRYRSPMCAAAQMIPEENILSITPGHLDQRQAESLTGGSILFVPTATGPTRFLRVAGSGS